LACWPSLPRAARPAKGGYGNTKHHNATGNKSAKKKNAKKKSSDAKKADEKEPEESTTTTVKKKEEPRFGYGVNLGALQFAGNTFQFGLSPNIAYKLSECLGSGFYVKSGLLLFQDQ
jgi:hypothetical protein